MLKRQTSGSVLCLSCDQLISVKAATCPHCGRNNPGMWGYARSLRKLGADLGFLRIVIVGCLTLYFLTLITDIRGIVSTDALNLLSPSSQSLLVFGASGAIPIFSLGRWWTVLTSGWLHGGLFHIGFNLAWIYNILPAVAQAYGAGRVVIIYTIANITSSLLTSIVAVYCDWLPDILQGADVTVGASGAIFGLFGALVAYGEHKNDSSVSQQAWIYAVVLLVLGFLGTQVDNWGHLGGFIGGYALCYLPWFNPIKRETQNHIFVAIICLEITLLAMIQSIISGVLLVQRGG